LSNQLHRFTDEVLPLLLRAFDRAFAREFEIGDETQAVVYTLGHAGIEDFKDIMTLIDANRGVGAFTLVRGMFERVVTTRYLRLHPEEIRLFLGYEAVHKRKTLNQAKNAGVAVQSFVAEEILQDTERAYEAVKSLYTETICKKCRTTRDQMSWTKKDLMTLAREVGLEGLYLTFCHWTTLHLHTTTFGMGIWLRHEGDTTFFDASANSRFADLRCQGHTRVLSPSLKIRIISSVWGWMTTFVS
jgi:hypothetical protein